jgi:hypothetical protein
MAVLFNVLCAIPKITELATVWGYSHARVEPGTAVPHLGALPLPVSHRLGSSSAAGTLILAPDHRVIM